MEAININLVSQETIKPSVQDHGAFKICLLDQITPRTYLPLIFFYLAQLNDQNAPTFSTRLKTSLSETLARFYPFSGRLNADNLSVHDFRAGVPFKEARAQCHMSHFLNSPSRTFLVNRFLPYRPFCNENPNPDTPQIAVQLTRFACGGVAVGACISHKLADTTTFAAFLKTWAAITRGNHSHDDLDLFGASDRFPAVDSLPGNYSSTYEKVWFQPGNYKSERFVFDEEALATLKARARSDVVPNPSRVLALSTFIWKSFMNAIKTAPFGTSPKSHIMIQTVNIRRRGQGHVTGPTNPMVRGNLFWGSVANHDGGFRTRDGHEDFGSLVEVVSESISEVNGEYMRSIRGSEAFDFVTEYLKIVEEVLSCGDSETLRFTSWVNMGLKDIDFGLGRPIWVGVYGGEGGPEVSNLVVLSDATWSRGIEAWVNVDENVLTVLRNDPEFLKFATVDPPIPIN